MAVKKRKNQHADPINELPESVYLPSTVRLNFDPKDQSPKFDEEMSRTYGLHMANAYADTLCYIRSHSFILGYMNHQRKITEPESKFIKVDEIVDLHIIERSDRNKDVLGRKVQLDFISPNTNKGETESISTGWIDYFGYGDTVFEICMARSIAATLVVLRDMEVPFQMRKALLPFTENRKGDKIRPRELADVKPVGGTERDAAVISQSYEALTIALEDSVEAALEYLHDEDLYSEYYDRAFGFMA